MIKKPLVTVLTPTHNRAGTFLAQTIESVQRQNEHGFSHEHIIIDNASTDHTKELVASYSKKDKRIKYICNRKNVLASGALNRGFAKSVGALILPLDDDDLIPRHALQWYVDYFKSHAKVDWAIAYSVFIDEQNRLLKDFSTGNPKVLPNPRKFLVQQLKFNSITNGAVMVRRRAVIKVGGWDESFPAAQDATFWLRLIHANRPYALLPQYLGFYRYHLNRLTTSHMKTGVWLKIIEQLKQKYNVSQAELDS